METASGVEVHSANPENYPERVFRSRHIRFQRTGGEQPLAYHQIFGNLAIIDRAMMSYLETMQEPVDYGVLANRIGPNQAAALWNSYFIVEDPEEERQATRSMLQERRASVHTGRYIGALQISSSNACNYSCSYCFADASDQRSPVRSAMPQNQNITFEAAEAAIRAVLAVARRNGRERIAVKFLGREPLINWPVVSRLLRTFNTGEIVWAITTNGSLITEEIADAFREHNVLTMVSLDGPPAANDALRVLKSGRGSYAPTERGILNLVSRGAPFGVSSVVSRATRFDTMEGFIERLVNWGVRELELTLVMQTDLHQISGTGTDTLAENLWRLYRRFHDKVLIHGDWVDPFHRIMSTHKFRRESEIQRPAGASCTATSHQISIEPTGDLFPCRAMSLHYGHISELESVLQSDAYASVVMRTFSNVRACQGCALEGFCQGTCLGSSESQFGDIYEPPPQYCDIYRNTTRLLLDRCGIGLE